MKCLKTAIHLCRKNLDVAGEEKLADLYWQVVDYSKVEDRQESDEEDVEGVVCWDDVSGETLDTEGVKKARLEEIEELRNH